MLVTMSDPPASAAMAQGATGSANAGAHSGATAGSPSSADRRAELALDESALLNAGKTGNPTAFNQLITIHQEKITRLVHRLLGWPSDVDDVVQDVFVDALKNLRRFDGRSNVLTWLTRLTINRTRTHQRRQWLRRHLPLPRGEGWGATEHDCPKAIERRAVVATAGATAAQSTTAEQNLITAETIHQVHVAIRQLNHRDREIIILRYLEESPIEEIANTLNLSRTAADTRLTRARKRLEKILEPLINPS